LERQGVLRFSADEAMTCMVRLIGNEAIQQSVLRMDWTRWRGLVGITGDVSPRFAHLLRGKAEETSSNERLATAAEVRDADGDARSAMVANIVGRKAATLLGMEPESMQWDRSLLSMGLDSLMAVEIRNWIESRLEIDLPISDLMRSESLSEVCQKVTRIVDASLKVPKDSDPEDLLEQLPEMSDETVDTLLAQMLNESKGEQPGG
jgi:acyl carrier protein